MRDICCWIHEGYLLLDSQKIFVAGFTKDICCWIHKRYLLIYKEYWLLETQMILICLVVRSTFILKQVFFQHSGSATDTNGILGGKTSKKIHI
jgi:hypothetical protein